MVIFDTKNSSGLGYNLVGNHASIPWGFNQPSLVPVSKLSAVFAEVDVGRVT